MAGVAVTPGLDRPNIDFKELKADIRTSPELTLLHTLGERMTEGDQVLIATVTHSPHANGNTETRTTSGSNYLGFKLRDNNIYLKSSSGLHYFGGEASAEAVIEESNNLDGYESNPDSNEKRITVSFMNNGFINKFIFTVCCNQQTSLDAG